MCTVLLPPGVNLIAVNKHININIKITEVLNCRQFVRIKSVRERAGGTEETCIAGKLLGEVREGRLDIMAPHHVTDTWQVWEYNTKVKNFSDFIHIKFCSCRAITCCVETYRLRQGDHKFSESYEMWCWRRKEKKLSRGNEIKGKLYL